MDLEEDCRIGDSRVNCSVLRSAAVVDDDVILASLRSSKASETRVDNRTKISSNVVASACEHPKIFLLAKD